MRANLIILIAILAILASAAGVAGVASATGAPTAANATTLTRAPYLQLGTDHSITIRWRTDGPTDSRVSFGPSPTNLTDSTTLPDSTIEHEVLLEELNADTIYYYSIGSSTELLAGADPDHWFLTAPATGTDTPTRVWVLGDSGTADA
ncbi:hypothetical protein DRQ53_16100, partial [bacterium]